VYSQAPKGVDGEREEVHLMIKFEACYPPAIVQFSDGTYVVAGRERLKIPEGTNLGEIDWMHRDPVHSVPLPAPDPASVLPKAKVRDWSRAKAAARRELEGVARRIEQGGARGRLRKVQRASR